MGDQRVDAARRHAWPTPADVTAPSLPARSQTSNIESRAASKRLDDFVTSGALDNGAAAEAAWAAVQNAPMPAPSNGPAFASGCSISIPLATQDNAGVFANRGVRLGLALQRSTLVSVADLEKFIDDYLTFSAKRPELKGLHDDASRVGPEILARRLDVEVAEQKKRLEEQRMRDRVAPLQIRPPLPVQQRSAVGEVAIPIATVVDDVAKFVPVVGEMLLAAEIAAGKTHAGLGFDIERSERIVSGALLLAPFAVGALASGVRGAAQLLRFARATGRTTEEARQLLLAAQTIEANQVALREGLAARRAGRALTPAQTAAFREADDALIKLRGAAAMSIFDAKTRSMLPVRSFAPNANGAVRTLEQATVIAEHNGVKIPSWIKIEIDPNMREAMMFAEYQLAPATETRMLGWEDLSPKGHVVVRVHPSVLQSDEKIVGVFQHEVWELSEVRGRVESKGILSATELIGLIDPTKDGNLHGQAWDVADLRVLIMREKNAANRTVLEAKLEQRIALYTKVNRR